MPWNRTSISRAVQAQRLWRERWAGAAGGYSAAWDSIIDRDPMLTGVVVAVDVILGTGRRFLLATETEGFDFGAARRGVVGLLAAEPEISSGYKLGSGAAEVRSFGVAMVLAAFDPWSEILSEGRPLAGWAEVSLVHRDLTWQQRLLVLRGRASKVKFGAAREAMSFSVSDPKITTDLGITEWIATTDRFPRLPEEYVGQRIPLAINSAFRCPAIRLDPTASPDWLVCYGHDFDVDGVTVEGQIKFKLSPDYPWDVQYLIDNKGLPYTAVRFTPGTGTWEDTTSVHATVSLRTDRNISTQNIVGTAESLLRDWSMIGPAGLAADLFARAQARVGSQDAPVVYINGSGQSSATRALEYVQGTLCGSFPMMGLSWQAGGLGPVLTDRRAPAVASWRVGQMPLLDRVGDWEERSEHCRNRFTLRHTYNPLTSSYTKILERHPGNSLLCQISEEIFGPRDEGPRETILIRSEALAQWVIDWLVAHLALPHYYAEYEVAPWVFVKHRLGDNVEIFDEQMTAGSTVPATICRFKRKRGSLVVGFYLWPLYQKIGGGAVSGESP